MTTCLTRCSISSNSDSAPAAEAPAGRGRTRLWQTLFGVAVSAVFLYLALRGISFSEVVAQVRRADALLFAASMIVVTLTFPARAIRWRVLLAAATGSTPPFRPVWLATAIGFMANNVLPARAGEFARAWAASKLVGPPVTTALSTIAVERIFDGVTVVTMLFIGIAAPGFPDGVRISGRSLSGIATLMGVVFLAAMVVLGITAHYPAPMLRFGERVFRAVLPSRFAEIAVKIARNIVDGLSVLRSPRQFLLVLFWSFVVWGLNSASYLLAFASFHLDSLPLSAALVLQGIVVLGVAIPSAPGFVGVFQLACVAALGVYGIDRAEAGGFAIALHLGWFIPITVLGILALLRAGLKFGELGSSRSTAKAPA